MLEAEGKIERLFPELEEPRKQAPAMKGLFDTIKHEVKASSIEILNEMIFLEVFEEEDEEEMKYEDKVLITLPKIIFLDCTAE
jgi:hypothetical protein